MYFQDALEYDDEIQETFDDWNDYEPDSTYCQDEAIDDMDNMFDTQEFDDIYSTYVDAKNRLNQLRQSRGFYPVVAVMESGKGQMPVMAQNPSKGKGKGSGKSKSPAKGKSPSKGGKGPMGKSRARSAMVCLRCGKPGHFAANCNSSQAAVETFEPEIFYNPEEADAQGEMHLVIVMVELPTRLAEHGGRIQAYVIYGATPMLFGRPLLEALAPKLTSAGLG